MFKSNAPRRTSEELMTLLKFIVGIALTVTLLGIVFAVLYSLIFVPQPLDAISPIDTKFFELIIPIATFLSGTLSGIMLGSTKEQPRAEEPAPAPVSYEPEPIPEYQEDKQ